MLAAGLVAFAQEYGFLSTWLLWKARRRGARFQVFFQMGLAWSNKASCCSRLAAKGMDAMQLAAETEVSVTVRTFS